MVKKATVIYLLICYFPELQFKVLPVQNFQQLFLVFIQLFDTILKQFLQFRILFNGC